MVHTETETETQTEISVLACTVCLGFMYAHPFEGGTHKACESGDFKPHTFASEAAHREAYEKKEIERLERRAREAVNTLINLNERADNYGPKSARECATLRCMRDVAYLLGGDSLRSFVRSAESLARMKATLSYDGAPLSVCFTAHGMYGGFIFHSHVREWNLHT